MGRIKRALAKAFGPERQPGMVPTAVVEQTNAGLTISDDSAMRYAAVQACVRVLAEDIAALPLHLYRRIEKGGKERATEHPLYRLLHDAPNPEMTAVAFKEALMVNLLLTGNGYAFIEYDGAGRVRALWPLLGSLVDVYRAENGSVMYRVGGKELSGTEMLHIPGLGYDGLVGLSPIAYARESIGLGMAAEQFGSAFFRNGTHLGGVISVPGRLSEDAFKRTSAEFKSMYRGLQNAHGIPVLEEGATFSAVGIAPEDAQFLETRKYQRSEIAGIFRVPPHLIGDLDKATFSNIEHQDISYLQRTLLPWLRRIEQGMQKKLLMGSEQAEYVIEHDTGMFMRGDTKSRYEAYAIGIQNGILTRNEARARENLNPLPGGDTLLQPLNMAAVGETDGEDAQRAFRMADVSSFTTDSRRRAVGRSMSAAAALGLEKAQIEALREGFSRWLEAQAAHIRKLIHEITGQRSKEQAEALKKALDKYYEDLAKEAMPKDIQEAVRSVTQTAIERVKADTAPGEAAPIDEAWLEGYYERYYANMGQRLKQANLNEIKKSIRGASQEDIDRLLEKLGNWGTDRAEAMAKTEAAMAVNEALVAGYRAAGYYSVWVSAPGCCQICTGLNGRTVTTLKPPLHKGCVCSVSKGEKKRDQALTEGGGNDKINLPRLIHQDFDERLPIPLDIDDGVIHGVIPADAEITDIDIIAGFGTSRPIRGVECLYAQYPEAGDKEKWQKKAGKVTSENYRYEVHWYENGENAPANEFKIKGRK